MPPIFDAHLDIAWNALSWDRDQLISIDKLNAAEKGMTGKTRSRCTVSLPEMRRGQIPVCVATMLARAYLDSPNYESTDVSVLHIRGHKEIIVRENLDYANQTIASAVAQGQLAYYRLLERQGHVRIIENAGQLDDIWTSRDEGNDRPLGIILSMEGCDPIVDLDQADWWWEKGLRTACLAHYGPSHYAMGTGADGQVTDRGRQLLRRFDELGMILDLVHTADTAVEQCLDLFNGAVFISHGNCRAIVDHDRQLSDEQIRLVAERGGVIGIVIDNWMLKSGWRQNPDRSRVSLETVADHIDHICQLAGSAHHVGIGSDLDGGYGSEQIPGDINTIADLVKLEPVLRSRGYNDTDINGVMHGNFLRFFRDALPAGQ